MAITRGLFDVEICLERLSALGDQLEKITAAVDFEEFRALYRNSLLVLYSKKYG